MSKSYAKGDVITTDRRTYVVESPAMAGAAKVTARELRGDRPGSRLFRVATSEIVGHYGPMGHMTTNFIEPANSEANRAAYAEFQAAERMMMDSPRYEMAPAPDFAPGSPQGPTFAPITVPYGFRFRLVARDGSRRAVQGMMF